MGAHNVYTELHQKDGSHFPASGRDHYIPGYGYLFGWGTTVGNGFAAGWSKGALFIDIDAAAGQQQWVNEGTASTATWKRKEAGDINLLAAEQIGLAATAYANFADNAYALFGTGSDVKLMWNGTFLEGGPVDKMWGGAPSRADPAYETLVHEYFNDFRHLTIDYDATNDWTMTEDDAACTQAISADTVLGTLLLTNKATTDNNGQQIQLQQESFKLAAGKQLWFEARVKFAAGATEIDWVVGMGETEDITGVADNFLDDGIAFNKLDGATGIDLGTHDNGANVASADIATATTGWVKLGFHFDGGASGAAVVTPYVNCVAKTAITTCVYATQGEISPIFMVRNGDGTTTQTMEIDYVKVVQLR